MTRPGAAAGGGSVHESALLALVQASPIWRAALQAVASLGLASWCIGAGAVRNLVWDHLHGPAQPTPLRDVDVAYFDADDPDPARDAALQAALQARMPGWPWEVTNQAGVHLWFEACFGHAVPPLSSLHEAVASWPETATCVGLTLDAQGEPQVIAPWGLDDLFGLTVRRNPVRVSLATYRERTRQKDYARHWPRVRVIE